MANGRSGPGARAARAFAYRSAMLRRRAVLALADLPPEVNGSEATALEDAFRRRAAAVPAPRVLELGTLRSQPQRSTMHREWVPHAAEYLGTDIEAGADVDVVADVHQLSAAVGGEQFDVVISCSTFEHLRYPWLAAHEVVRVLAPGGLLFVQTHQSFPLHGFPSDYFRFSRDALTALFERGLGFTVAATAYAFPARVYSRRTHDTQLHPAYLNTLMWGEKTGPTPDAPSHDL